MLCLGYRDIAEGSIEKDQITLWMGRRKPGRKEGVWKEGRSRGGRKEGRREQGKEGRR